MFFQLLYIHLYRPFLKYTRSTSPLPSHVSPRKYCTQAAGAVSKLFRLYKRTYGLRQICNIAIYIVHSACTIHLLNLPDKNARRDIVHGIKHLEEMGECWTAARRTLRVLRLCADRWNIEIPEEAEIVYSRIKVKWGQGQEGSSPVSPQTIGHMAQQITSQPVPDLMARNIQQQQQQSIRQVMMIPQTQGGMSAPMAPSPAETIDTRRSSGNLSMPPQSAADLSRDLHRVRPSTYLTKAQHDAWNAHQARLATTSAAASAQPTATADKLFGGVDSLIEDTQDWFFKDQNQLAMGFGNWVEPQQDWGTLDLSFFDTDGAGAATANTSYVNTNDSSPAYNNGGTLQPYTSYDPGPVNGNGYAYGGHAGNANATNNIFANGGVNSSKRGMGSVSFGTGVEMKRPSQQAQNNAFDDDMYY